MSLKLLNGLFLASTLTFSMLISSSALACDDKSCETAYLAETKQHIANQIRRANTYKVERHAYSMNRERRAYAKFVHIHFMWVRAKFLAL
ncbi:MAG: hypothetical protein V7749_09950 [Cocleimonas sp.]